MFPKRLSLLTLAMTAIGCSRVQGPPPRPHSVCSELRIQESQWSGSLVKTTLACALYRQGTPSVFYSRLIAIPETDFNESARWLNTRLSRDNRGAFLGQLEDVPSEFIAFIKQTKLDGWLTNPELPNSLPFLHATFQMAREDQGRLYGAAREFFRLSQAQGRFVLPRSLVDALADSIYALRRMTPDDRAHAMPAFARLTDAIAPSPRLQRTLSLVSDVVRCRKGQDVRIESTLDFSLKQLVANRQDPERFLSILSLSYVPLRDVCDPQEELNPEAVREAMAFVAANYGSAADFAEAALAYDLDRPVSRLLGAGVAPAVAAKGNLLGWMKQSGTTRALFEVLARREGPSAAWLKVIPERRELETLLNSFRFDDIAAFLRISPHGIDQLASLLDNFDPDPPLLREWQKLVTQMGAESVPALTDYITDGHLRELAKLLKEWTNEKEYAPATAPTSAGSVVPIAPAPPRSDERGDATDLRMKRLIEECLGDRVGLSDSYACIRRISRTQGLTFPYLESADFQSFLRQIDGHDPVFGLARAAEAMGWLDGSSNYDDFFLGVIEMLDPFRMPMGHIMNEVAAGDALANEDISVLEHMIVDFELPTLRSNATERLRYLERDLRVSGLPLGWKEYLEQEFTSKLVEGLFIDPSVIRNLIRAVSARARVTLETVGPDNQLGATEVELNGMELIDALVWEAQLGPLWGRGNPIILKTLIKEMKGLNTPTDVVDWVAAKSKSVDQATSFYSKLPLRPAHILAHLRNMKLLLGELASKVPPEGVLAAAKLTSGVLPKNISADEEVAFFLLLHRMGLVPSQSRWLESSARFRADAPDAAFLMGPEQRRVLAQGFGAYLHMANSLDVDAVMRLNLSSDGQLLASGMDVYVNAAERNRPAAMLWSSRVVALVTLPLFRQMANDPQLSPRERMRRVMPLARPLMRELGERLLRTRDSSATRAFLHLLAVRKSEFASLRGLEDAAFLKSVESPEGRRAMIPWIRSGAMRTLVEWARHVQADEAPK